MKKYILAFVLAAVASTSASASNDCGDRAGGGLLPKRDHSAFLSGKPSSVTPVRTVKGKGSN
jgi:hypothetical protein